MVFWMEGTLLEFKIYLFKKNVFSLHSQFSYSDEHMKLVFALNFYLFEGTAKSDPNSLVLSNTIVTANAFLNKTINLEQYQCFLYVSFMNIYTHKSLK